MPTYEIEAGGKAFEVEAPDVQTAAKSARSYVARVAVDQGAANARAGAESRAAGGGNTVLGTVMKDERGRTLAIPQMAQGLELDPSTTEGKINNLGMLAAGGIAGVQAAGGIVPFMVGTAKSLAGSYLGAKAGREVGGIVGHPEAGATVGGVVGGIAAPMVTGSSLLDMLSGGKTAALRAVLGGGESTAAAQAERTALNAARAAQAERIAAAQAERATAQAEASRALAASRMAQAERAAAMRAQAQERHAAQMELLKRRIEGKAPLRSPKAPAPSVAPATEAPAASTASPIASPAPDVAPFDYTATKGDVPTIVQQLQQRASMPGGKQAVEEEIKKLPKELVGQVRLELARGQAHPATVVTPGPPRLLRDIVRSEPPVAPDLAAGFKRLQTFASREAPNAKFGEKIWLEVDDAGNPLRVLTPNQRAGAGRTKTFIRAVWGRGAAAAEEIE